MRALRLLLAALAPTITSLAQTNTEPVTNTETAITNSYTAPQATAPVSTATSNAAPANLRLLSLQECIQLTLQHNLDLQIDRYNPEIALFTYQSSYGGYDPTLALSGEHTYSESGARLLGSQLALAGSTTDANIFNGSLTGLLPSGATYTLQGSANDTYGSSGTTVPNLGAPMLVTNTIQNINNNETITYITTNFPLVAAKRPFESSSAQATIAVTQPLLKNFWIDNTRLAIRVNRNRLKYSELGLKLQIMTTITTLEQAYYELIFNRANVEVQQKAVELAEQTVSENRKKLEVGALAPLDLANAEAQAAQSRAAVIAAKSQLGTQERKLKGFIADSFSQWADIPIEPIGSLTAPRMFFDRTASWSRGLTQRPEILQAKLDLERAGIQLKYDRNQLYPELDVFGTFGYNGAGKEFSGALFDIQEQNLPTYTFGGQISVPLANITARNNYKSAKVSVQQAVLTVKRWERDIMIQIDNDIGTLQADYDQVLATRAQRQYEEQALAAEQKKLENGKSTTYTVLQVQRDLTNARGAEIQALDTYNRDMAQFSLDEGTTLERLNIDLRTY